MRVSDKGMGAPLPPGLILDLLTLADDRPTLISASPDRFVCRRVVVIMNPTIRRCPRPFGKREAETVQDPRRSSFA